jgi:predicted flavoprotein YhiN
VLRAFQTPGGVVVQDLQDNNVTLSRAPQLFNGGRVSVVVIDRVLMSGGYFFNGADALE